MRRWKALSSCANKSPASSSLLRRRGSIPSDEITVTCGATEALYDAIQAVVGPGDEVIIFDPAYDAYEPAVRLAGARCVRIRLAPPAFRFDWDDVRRSTERSYSAHHHQQSAKSQLHR